MHIPMTSYQYGIDSSISFFLLVCHNFYSKFYKGFGSISLFKN